MLASLATILEVAIGMVLVYLLLSLMCSTANELLVSVFAMRAKTLEVGIQKLLGDLTVRKSGADTAVAKLIYETPMIKGLVGEGAIEKWFDDAMDQASGWYKAHTHCVILIIASVVAVALNVDSVAIAAALWRDPMLRASVVAAAEAKAREARDAEPKKGKDGSGGSKKYDLKIEELNQELLALQIPIGWTSLGWGGITDK